MQITFKNRVNKAIFSSKNDEKRINKHPEWNPSRKNKPDSALFILYLVPKKLI